MLKHFVGCHSHALSKANAYAAAIPMLMPLSYSTYVYTQNVNL